VKSVLVKVTEWEYLGSIPGFSREVDDNSTFISYYAASNGNLLLMFPWSLSVKQFLDSWPLKMGLIDCPETSKRNY